MESCVGSVRRFISWRTRLPPGCGDCLPLLKATIVRAKTPLVSVGCTHIVAALWQRSCPVTASTRAAWSSTEVLIGMNLRDKEKRRASMARYERSQKGKLAFFKKTIKRKYGLSLGEWAAMLIAQSGRCAACGDPMFWITHEPCVDHDHETGK